MQSFKHGDRSSKISVDEVQILATAWSDDIVISFHPAYISYLEAAEVRLGHI